MSALPSPAQFCAAFDALTPIRAVPPVRQSNELLLEIIRKTGPFTPAEARYVAECEARAA